MRPLVHEPMNTRSMRTSRIRVPTVSPMYRSERSIARRLLSLGAAAGSGTAPVIGTTSSGLVPQVTSGAMLPAERLTSLS